MENNVGDVDSWLPLNEEFSTLAIHVGYIPEDKGNSALIPPITTSTTYKLDSPAINRVITIRHYRTL